MITQTSAIEEGERSQDSLEQTPFSDSSPLWASLAGAIQVRNNAPDEAERRIHEILKIAPGLSQALQLLVDGRCMRGDFAGARTMLEAMAAETPGLATVHFELGVLLSEMGEWEKAVSSLSRVVELEPKHPQAWRVLGDTLVQTGDTNGAANTYAKHFASSVVDLTTLEQVAAFDLDQAEVAESVLREYQKMRPTDLNVLDTLASLHMRAGQFESAESLFKHALDLAPSFQKASFGYISALHQQLKSDQEIRQLDLLLADDPDNAKYRELKTLALSASGKVHEAVSSGEELVRLVPDRPNAWLIYGHVLRVAGRQNDCVGACQKAVELDPYLYEAWLGLANLKTYRFGALEVDFLRTEPNRENITDENREFRHFALGKALEDLGAFRESFEQYQLGNALIRTNNPYDVDVVAEGMQREKRRFTREFFRVHAKDGSPINAPVFILGLPRSGSTLVEQILASHSSVEGCGELPALPFIARRLEATLADKPEPSGDTAEALFQGENLEALGTGYLDRSGFYRRLSRPYFTDKMPSNFHHLGLICAILPNAKIIDVRRHPLDCCVSNFKQIFPNQRDPSYDLADMGRYYRGYIELLAHFDRILPGHIHRVIYEDLVRNPEVEVRKLLAYCGLPFEESCLRFYETERGIRTISSEQVRRPMYKDSIAQWRNYEEWLGPLKSALGPVLDTYPAVPEIF